MATKREARYRMEIERDYEPEPLSVRNVRQLVGKGLRDTTPHSDDVVLVASELATNAIIHAQTPFRVRLTTQDHIIRLEVFDQSSTIPVMEELCQSQRGLRIVQTVATDWGIDPTPTGKTVWAEFELPATEHTERQPR